MSVGQSKTIPGRYQANVGRLQGADTLYLKAGGYLAFIDYEFSGVELKNYLVSQFTVCAVDMVDDSCAPSLFSYAYGYHMVSTAQAASKMSMKLPLPSAGMYLCLVMANAVPNNATSVLMSMMASTAGGVTGVSVVRATGSAISTLLLLGSARLGLICLTDGTWSIVESNKVTAQAAS